MEECDKELSLERAKIEFRKQEVRVLCARREMEEGYKKAFAEAEKEYAKLKAIYEIEQLDLEKSGTWVKEATKDLEKIG